MSRSRLLRCAMAMASLAAGPAVSVAEDPAAEPAGAAAAGPPSPGAEAPQAEVARQPFGETITVTGSRIRRKELTTPAPVLVIGRDEIQASGLITFGDFLQTIPEQANGTNTTVNNGGDGSTQVSLRGLGPQRTLVLVDGKRFITGVPGTGAVSGDPGADLNSFPTAAIERIEILKDGASAVYGADAIGGVVNIITRKHLDGVEARVTQSTSEHGDASVTDVNVLGGASSEKGSFLVGAGYYHQGALPASSRDWSAQALTYDFANHTTSPGGSSAVPAGYVTLDPSTCTNALCQGLKNKYGAGSQGYIPDPSSPLGWRPYNAPSDAYNFQSANDLITPSERFSLYGNGEYRLGENARAYFHSTFVNRQSSNQLAPEPLFTLLLPNEVVYSAQNQYNPFGIDLFDVRRRLVEAGDRSQAQDIDTAQVIVGVDGELPEAFGPLARWFYDLSFNYARNDETVTTQGSLNAALIAQGLGPSKNGVCYTDSTFATPIPGCTPINLFGPLTPTMVQSLGAFTGVDHGGNQMTNFEASLSGDLFRLASDRPVGLALGYAYRAEYGFFTFNPIAVTGNDTEYSGLNTAGGYHVNEEYAELSVPVVSHRELFEALELSAALRLSEFSSFGEATTYKLGVRYSPLRDFTLRGTYSTGIRAPGIATLYGGSTPNAESASDPCASVSPAATAAAKQCAATLSRGGGGPAAVDNGDSRNQIVSTNGGNPGLQPEKSEAYTVGIVLEPRAIPGLSLTADLYSIKITQEIDTISTPVILAACYPAASGSSAAPNPAACNLVQRDAAGFITNVNDTFQNAGELFTQGLDVALRYGLPTEVGRFTFVGDSNFLFKFDKTLADGTVIHGKGTYDLGVNPPYKFNLGLRYDRAGFMAEVRGRFIGPYHECADATAINFGLSSGSGLCYLNPAQANGVPFPVHEIPLYDLWDLHLAYTAGSSLGRTTVAAGVRNVFDANPPPVYDTQAQTNSDPATYDYVGRVFYAELEQKF
ncbi:MAG TPA: TonB-dependent receptor [Anaeromyxobacteraceae bacterium]|nr:TonB-dependent receptor [Anaeromyxobacteraceae bacterium]